MIKLIYDKGNCTGCPPYMGCLGAGCPHCWETHMICDECKAEGDELWNVKETGAQLCESCRDKLFDHITIDNAEDFTDESNYI